MDHREMERKLSAYLDNAVSTEEKEEFKRHLSICGTCRGALADLELTVWHIQRLPQTDPPPWLTSRIMERVQEPVIRQPGFWQRLFTPLRVKLPLAVGIILVLGVAGYYLAQRFVPELPPLTAPILAPHKKSSPAQGTQPSASTTTLPAGSYRVPAAREGERDGGVPEANAPAATAPAPPTAPVQVVPQQARPASVPELPASEEWLPPGREPSPSSAREERGATHGTVERHKKGASDEEVAELPSAGTLHAGELEVSLKVDDPAVSAGAIEKAVSRLGGRITGRAYSGASHLLYTRVDAEKFPVLMERLGKIGKVRERPQLPEDTERTVDLLIKW